MRNALSAFLFLSILVWSVVASAAPTCDELPCSVNRNCSSTGMACRPDERECTDEARRKSLEVKCEQKCEDGQRLVYCPPDAGRSDSRVVWILLSVAVAIAITGTSVAWIVLRKKPAA